MSNTLRTAIPWFLRQSTIHNPRWAGIVAIVITLAICGAAAQAQQAGKIPRIGYLSPVSASRDSTRREAFRQGLQELGYIEGQKVTIEYRFAEGRLNRFAELATELVRLKVDVIIAAGGSPLARAVKSATGTIPIVMTNAADPVADGLIASLAHPGGILQG